MTDPHATDYCWLGSQGMCKKNLRALMAQEDDDQAYLCGEGCYSDE